jgi:hypothetical protein
MTQDLRAGLAELAGEVRSVDLHDRVLKGSRRLAIRQRVIGSTISIVAVAGVTSALMLLRPDGGEVKPPIESATPTLASPSAAPSPSPDPTLSIDLRNATFALPEFPGDAGCPAGVRKFTDGRASADPKAEPEPTELVQIGEPIMANVDGVPGAEILTGIACIGYVGRGQVLALKVLPNGELSALGFVLQSPDHPTFEVHSYEPIIVHDGVIEVSLVSPGVPDGGHAILDLQVRGYRFQNGSFRQVSGPAKFANPPSDPTMTDFANATVQVPTSNEYFIVKLTNGAGRARVGKTSYTVTMVRSEWVETDMGPRAVVLYRLADSAGFITETIAVYEFGIARVPADHLFIGVASGKDGIAHIQTFDMVGKEAKVTVELAGGGTQIRTYRDKANGQGWERVS